MAEFRAQGCVKRHTKTQIRHRSVRWWSGRSFTLAAMCVFWCSLAKSSMAVGSEFSAVEGQLRAAVTVGVLRFTSWQDPSILRSENIQLCLVGNPVSEPFLLPVDGETQIGRKKLNVRRANKKAWEGCQAFVIGDEAPKSQMKSLLAYAAEKNILTVCDGCVAPLAEDTMIQLKLEKQRVKFDVNLGRANAASVHLDASLLELASVVKK